MKRKTGKIKHTATIVDDIKFHSKMESEYYLKLKEDKQNGLIKDFSLQPKFLLQEAFIIVDGKAIRKSDDDFNKIKRRTKASTILAINYVSDFLITNNDDTQHLVDTKGISTKDFEIKKKMFMLLYPHLRLDVLIYNKYKDTWDDYYEYQKLEKTYKEEAKVIKEKERADKKAAKAIKKTVKTKRK